MKFSSPSLGCHQTMGEEAYEELQAMWCNQVESYLSELQNCSCGDKSTDLYIKWATQMLWSINLELCFSVLQWRSALVTAHYFYPACAQTSCSTKFPLLPYTAKATLNCNVKFRVNMDHLIVLSTQFYIIIVLKLCVWFNAQSDRCFFLGRSDIMCSPIIHGVSVMLHGIFFFSIFYSS